MIYEWTLIKTDQTPGALHTRFPDAGSNNSDNFFFVASDPLATDPIIIRELITAVPGDADYWQVFIMYLLEELMFLNRERHIQISKDEARHLHAYAGWRIWMNAIGEYDDDGIWIEDLAGIEAAWIETQVWYPDLQKWNPPLPWEARKQQLESVWKRNTTTTTTTIDVDDNHHPKHHHHHHHHD